MQNLINNLLKNFDFNRADNNAKTTLKMGLIVFAICAFVVSSIFGFFVSPTAFFTTLATSASILFFVAALAISIVFEARVIKPAKNNKGAFPSIPAAVAAVSQLIVIIVIGEDGLIPITAMLPGFILLVIMLSFVATNWLAKNLSKSLGKPSEEK